MAHPEQRAFCDAVKARFPDHFAGKRVLEIGSRDINGSVRGMFDEGEFVGIDATAGRGVDVVCLAHEYDAEPASFDVVCSLETFEHDPHADKSVKKMFELLRPSGLFFMTCAGDGRPEHGTRRTGKLYGPDPDFYRNVSMSALLEWLEVQKNPFTQFFIQHNTANSDLYFYGIKG